MTSLGEIDEARGWGDTQGGTQNMIMAQSHRRNKRSKTYELTCDHKKPRGHTKRGPRTRFLASNDLSSYLGQRRSTKGVQQGKPKTQEKLFPLSTHQYKNGCTARRVLRPSVTTVTLQQNLEESTMGVRGIEELLNNLRTRACERGRGYRG